MRIAIVDDIAAERELLEERLKVQLARRTLPADLYIYENGEDFLAAAEENSFSLVFLDIYMEGLNGIDTAERLRTFDTDCMLVFTTTSTDHALDGFRVRAMHYLVKPYSEEDLEALFEEIEKRQPEPEKYIEIKTAAGKLRLCYREILYATHFEHRVYIHSTDGREIITRKTFSEFVKSLSDNRFFQCSRGLLVNLEHAVDFDGAAFLLPGSKRIPVKRELKKQAQSAFGDFLFERGKIR